MDVVDQNISDLRPFLGPVLVQDFCINAWVNNKFKCIWCLVVEIKQASNRPLHYCNLQMRKCLEVMNWGSFDGPEPTQYSMSRRLKSYVLSQICQ
jgi:hypothetical protein